MRIFFFTVMIILSSAFNLKAAELDLSKFKSIILTKSVDTDRFYKYFNDYVSEKNKDDAIYRSFEMPFSADSEDALIFTNVFDVLACGVNNCPYKVFLKKADGEEKQVLEGIGPDTPEDLFKVKANGNAPIDINVGIYIYKYDEKEGQYVETK